MSKGSKTLHMAFAGLWELFECDLTDMFNIEILIGCINSIWPPLNPKWHNSPPLLSLETSAHFLIWPVFIETFMLNAQYSGCLTIYGALLFRLPISGN